MHLKVYLYKKELYSISVISWREELKLWGGHGEEKEGDEGE